MSSAKTGKICWQSPSNIALVKYWGKKGRQVPANPSLSFTLSRAVTIMKLEYAPGTHPGEISLEFSFDGEKNAAFEKKISAFLEEISGKHTWLKGLHLEISSRNTFPHSAGIASSASSMSALALCLASLENRFLGAMMDETGFFQKASGLARLASGSACRSVYGGLALWGKVTGFPGSSDEFAIPYPGDIHEIFRDYRDTILVVNKGEKKISSRAGHALMEGHPYADGRYALAARHLEAISQAIGAGDLDAFIRIVEAEALGLHALMMTSAESYLLIEPGTLSIVNKIMAFRRDGRVPVCFTLDAGPNVHLLYPAKFEQQVLPWIEAELKIHCQEGMVLHDEAGNGPREVTELI